MKKLLRSAILITLVLVVLLSLASCSAKPKGTYSNSLLSLTFDGDDVTAKVLGSDSLSVSGKYKLGDEGEIIITWDDGEDSSAQLPTGLTYNKDDDKLEYKLAGITFSLEKSK